jgi:hypothetical protein
LTVEQQQRLVACAHLRVVAVARQQRQADDVSVEAN